MKAADTAPAIAETNSSRSAEIPLTEARPGIWDGEVGAGFHRSVTHFGVVAGAGPGLKVCGSREANHLALAGISYGKMWGDMWGKDRWWHGNWEWRLELLAGSTFSPSTQYFVGLTPHLRYNFATGTRWIPFADFGTGVSATAVREPNLGGPFQFNTQVSLGMNYFLKDNLALSLEGRAMHVSSAGIYQPNNGMNNVLILAGVNWFF
jgi:hypothetical protein